MINFAIFKIFAAWQDSANGQSGAVLNQICIFVCGLNLFLPFLRINFYLKFTDNFVFKFEFLKRAEFVCLLDLDFGKFARFCRQIYLAFCRLKTVPRFM